MEQNAAQKPSAGKTLARLFRIAGSLRWFLPLSLILSAAAAVSSLLPLASVWYVLNLVLSRWGTGQPFGIGPWVVLAFAGAAGGVVLSFLSAYCSHLTAFRVEKQLRFDAMSRLMSLPLGFVQATTSGNLQKVINENASLTHSLLAHLLPDVAGTLASLLTGLIFLVYFDFRLGLICFIPLAVGFWFLAHMNDYMKDQSMGKYMDALQSMNGAAVEYIRGIPVIKTFQQTVHSFRKFKASVEAYYHFVNQYALDFRRPYSYFVTAINSPVLLLIPAALFLAGRSSDPKQLVASVIFYCLLTPALSVSISKIMYASENVSLAIEAVNRIDQALNASPLSVPSAPRRPSGFDLEFRDVWFTYPGTTRPALRGVSFHLPQGQVWALVGPSGGGKSTIASLAARFWDPDKGDVLLGGEPEREMDPKELMSHIGLVFQNDRLFKTSIRNNILAARPDAGEAEALKAASSAQCGDILEKLPQGLDTVIGAGGVYLSGGETQRIALARMIAKDAPVVILDEATAFADPENEAQIQKALTELARDKTTLMIAHRLSSVRNADRILVIDDGQIAESGTHDELLASGGLYAKMWAEYQKAAQWKVASEEASR